MTLKNDFQSASLFNKLCLIFSIIAMLTGWISFVMTAWGWNADADNSQADGYGLWRMCGQGKTGSGCVSLVGWNLGWYQGVQATAILGFMGINLAFLLIILQVFVDKCKGVKEMAFWNGIQCVITGFFYLIAIIIFLIMFDDDFQDSSLKNGVEMGYSWGLAIVALVFNAIAVAILQFLEGKSAIKG